MKSFGMCSPTTNPKDPKSNGTLEGLGRMQWLSKEPLLLTGIYSLETNKYYDSDDFRPTHNYVVLTLSPKQISRTDKSFER